MHLENTLLIFFKLFLVEIVNILYSRYLKFVKKHKINLVVPGSDEDALNLSKNRKKIEIGKTKIACISYESLKILSNKSKTYKFLKDSISFYLYGLKQQIKRTF